MIFFKNGLFFLIFLVFVYPAHSEHLMLSDFSGQKGPAPPPAPYATTTLTLQNSPIPISHFYFEIWYSKNTTDSALRGFYLKLNSTVFDGWNYAKAGHSSSSERNAYTVFCWTTGSPIPKGTTIDLANITFEVKNNKETTVTIQNCEHDFKNFTTKSAQFVPGKGEAAKPFVPHVYGDINLDGRLDMEDVLTILKKISGE